MALLSKKKERKKEKLYCYERLQANVTWAVRMCAHKITWKTIISNREEGVKCYYLC